MAIESKDNNTTPINESSETTTTVKSEENKEDSKKQKKKRFSLVEYFKGVRLEMKKVVWPTKKELGSFTAIVLATCIAFAIVFWGVDTGVLAALKAFCF